MLLELSQTKKRINNATTIAADLLKIKATLIYSLVKKVGDGYCKYKGLFEDDHQLMDVMKVEHDDVHGLDVDVNFTIEAINTGMAELNQELLINCLGSNYCNS
jgi:trigger factor